MNWKNLTKRIVALLLCAVTLLPMLPQSAWAAPVDAVAKLSGLPYIGGQGSTLLTYDCGNGVTGDGAKSCMRIIRKTTAAEFNTYCSSVLGAKLNLVYSKDITSNESGKNLFRKYAAKNGSYSVYTYYLPDYDEARIIVDTNRDTVEGFRYTEQTGKTGVTPKMVMWGLSTSSTGYHKDTTTPSALTGRITVI